MTGHDRVTIDQAAALTGVSRDTIKRRLRTGRLPNATRGNPHGHRDRPWLIPVSDLAAAGLPLPNQPAPGGPARNTGNPDNPPRSCRHCDRLNERIDGLTALAAAQERHIDDLRTQLAHTRQLLDQHLRHRNRDD
jgi:hypothetical protein